MHHPALASICFSLNCRTTVDIPVNVRYLVSLQQCCHLYTRILHGFGFPWVTHKFWWNGWKIFYCVGCKVGHRENAGLIHFFLNVTSQANKNICSLYFGHNHDKICFDSKVITAFQILPVYLCTLTDLHFHVWPNLLSALPGSKTYLMLNRPTLIQERRCRLKPVFFLHTILNH